MKYVVSAFCLTCTHTHVTVNSVFHVCYIFLAGLSHVDFNFGKQNGKPTERGRFPYMISLQDTTNTHQCGAVLIDSSWALTAAHCVHPEFRKSVRLGIILVVGAHGRNDRTQDYVKVIKLYLELL